MASGGAGALLLRAAALGGLTAAAWLLGGTTASADSEPPPPVEISIEVPTLSEGPVLFESLALSEDPAAWARSFTAAVIEKNQPEKLVSPPVVTKPEEQPQQERPQEEDEGPTLDFSGGTQGNTRSGSISNTAPPEVIAAKAQARAARKAAKLAAEMPPPPPAPPVVAVTRTVPLLPVLRVPAPVKTEPAPVSDLNWTVPGPDAPLPAPPSAPVVTTASASSGHTDNSGGTRGVLAVLTSHNSLFPPTTWSVDERRDGTVPGSIPGLPATSPD
ncbi:hypothetical protein [Lentzea sp. E54]|uniref:hypothetical protein n=1 Tax=Lentzea xerophila TaxID=3435883 RepID=UPI003DA429E5